MGSSVQPLRKEPTLLPGEKKGRITHNLAENAKTVGLTFETTEGGVGNGRGSTT